MHRSRTRRLGALAAFLVLPLALLACGDDDEDTASTADDEVGEVDDGTTTTTTEDAPDGEAVEVTAVDYAFEGLPESVPAGTVLSLRNDSAAELHELVAVRIPDDEERPVSELVALPEEELGFLEAGVVAVLLAPPGSDEQIPAVGDGTLAEPGRYAIVCFVPTGVDPQVFLDAAAESEGGPPEIEGAGPPHVVNGMFTELTVE